MNESSIFILSFLIGSAAGALFFAGLWWTVRRALATNSSPLWLPGSWLLRMAFTLCGFYAVTVLFPGKYLALYLFATLAGFVAARWIVNWYLSREDHYASKP